MPIINIRFPTNEEEERSRRFTVHKNYLRALQLFLEALYGRGDALASGLVDAQQRLPGFQRMNRRPVADVGELRRMLSISWASELQLRLASVAGDAFLRYSNAWSPVQAYYAVYMSIHGWLVTVGMGGLLDDHTRTLKTAVNHLVGRGLLPHPWAARCEGCPGLGERQMLGFPAGVDLDSHIELLSRPSISDFYPRFAKMLETTRDTRLRRLRKERLKQTGRKRMLAAQKRQLASRLHSTTVLDYLWRLRIRSNYGDVSAYLMSGVSDADHSEFHHGLVTLTDATCLLVQSVIVAQVGPEPYMSAAQEFAEGGGVGLGEPAAFVLERSSLLTGRP